MHLLSFAATFSVLCVAFLPVCHANEVPSTCPPGGVWSEWTTTGPCSTTCGSCSTAPRKRTCLTQCGECPCTGPSEDEGPCGISLCPFPSTSTCCAPYVKSLNANTQSFFCGPGGVVNNVTCNV